MRTNLQLFRIAANRFPAPSSRRLVVLTGARQTGKTTLARKAGAGAPAEGLRIRDGDGGVRAWLDEPSRGGRRGDRDTHPGSNLRSGATWVDGLQNRGVWACPESAGSRVRSPAARPRC